jgi:hypothetical protein
MNASRAQTLLANLRIVEGKSKNEGLSFYASLAPPGRQNRAEGAFTQSPHHSNIFNLPSYRRQRSRLYWQNADSERKRSLGISGGGNRNAAFDESYAERMKVNGGIFVFLVFLILSGVWLMDGLSKAFGH